MPIKTIDASAYVSKTSVLELVAAEKKPSDYMRLLKKLDLEVQDLARAADAHIRALGSVELIMPNGTVYVPKSSPQALVRKPTYLKIPNEKQLRQQYDVVMELHEKSRSLDLISAELSVKYGEDSPDGAAGAAKKAHAYIQVIRANVDRALNTAAAFLTKMAKQHQPTKFEELNVSLARALARGLNYDSVTTYLYVYPNRDGGFVFVCYFRLMKVRDENGKITNELFVVSSSSPDAAGEMNFKLTTMLNFLAPGKFALGKSIQYKKPSDINNVKKILGYLLDMDNVANDYARVPWRDLLRPNSQITKQSFTLDVLVESLEADDDTMTFTFNSSVDSLDKASKLAAELSTELTVLVKNTKARQRMSIFEEEGRFKASFFFVRPQGFAVNNDDLAFLKDRFSLDSDAIDLIRSTINSSGNTR